MSTSVCLSVHTLSQRPLIRSELHLTETLISDLNPSALWMEISPIDKVYPQPNIVLLACQIVAFQSCLTCQENNIWDVWQRPKVPEA